jgi:hypothetical protein
MALTKVLGKVHEATTALQGGIVLGELAETLRMLRRPASGLRDGLNRWLDDAKRQAKRLGRRRGRALPPDPHGVTRASKALADTWLEHVFGWGPLISDIEGAHKAILQVIERGLYPIKRVSAQADSAAPTEMSAWLQLIPDASPAYIRWSRDHKISTRYKVAVAMEPRDSLRVTALDSFGLRAREFLPTVWELIPYSFLIDYFTNIGDVVGTLAVQRSRILWIVKTRVDEYRNELYACSAGVYFSGGTEGSWSPRPKATYTKRNVTRSTPAYLNTPHLEFEIPGFGSRKWLNIAALVRSGRSTESAVRRSLRL